MLLLCFGAIWYFSSGFGLSLTFGCRLSCFLFVSFAPIVFVFRCLVFFLRVLPKSTWRLTFTKCKNNQPDLMRSLELFIFYDVLGLFALICADLNRLSGCHDVTQDSHLRNAFRLITPSAQPHLPSCVRSTRRWSFGWISLAMFARLATPSWFLLWCSTSFTASA